MIAAMVVAMVAVIGMMITMVMIIAIAMVERSDNNSDSRAE